MNSNKPIINWLKAGKKAEKILSCLTLKEKIEFTGGHNLFFIKGIDRLKIPELYLSDATQGIHIRKDLSQQLEKSTSFPCPIALTSTWNPKLAYNYAKSIGEECRAGGIAVLLGPGVNIYRISQCGRNFEYFGEDPFLASRMVEKYIIGLQSTKTLATLKHFLCNNTDYHRRTSNSIVDERTLHEIYLPAFKAGIDAGAMAVMTAYNQLNGEYCGQSEYVIKKLLREELQFKGLVMSDWWSVYDPIKTIKSGLDLEMPGVGSPNNKWITDLGDIYVKSNAEKLLTERKVDITEIDRMVKSVLQTSISMGLYKNHLKKSISQKKFHRHEKVALNTAREAIVLLENKNAILPLSKDLSKKILVTGEFVDRNIQGGGSAEVEGYNNITILDALKKEFKSQIEYVPSPTDDEIKKATYIIVNIGTADSEAWDRPFELPSKTDEFIQNVVSINPNTIIVVNSGGGIKMTVWNNKVAAILYSWYIGQNGNIALAEILSGKINPSGKLPISIEQNFSDSPGYPYIPEGEELYIGWDPDLNIQMPINNIVYKEGVFVGYRWYENKNIKPLYPFGYGLSYTNFEYSKLKLKTYKAKANKKLKVTFNVKNIGKKYGAEIAQLYIKDIESSVPRPMKELKGFKKVFLKVGKSSKITIILNYNDFAFWDVQFHQWKLEPGTFEILIGSSSKNIHLTKIIYIK